MGQAIADPVPDRRGRGRKHHPAQQLPAGEAVDPGHFDVAVGHALHALAGIDRHRHQGGLGDQQELELLVDADQQHQQRQPAQGGHLAEGLEQREQVVAQGGRQAHGAAQQQAGRQPDAKAREHAYQADLQVVPQFAAGQQGREAVVDRARRRQHLLGCPALQRRQLPQQQQGERKQPGQQPVLRDPADPESGRLRRGHAAGLGRRLSSPVQREIPGCHRGLLPFCRSRFMVIFQMNW